MTAVPRRLPTNLNLVCVLGLLAVLDEMSANLGTTAPSMKNRPDDSPDITGESSVDRLKRRPRLQGNALKQ